MSDRLNAMWLIQLFIGIFLTASALIFLTGSHAGSEIAKIFGKNNSMNTVIAILELISGILLIAALFIGSKPKFLFLALVVIFVLWTLNILSMYFFNGFMKPNFMVWVKNVSLYLVVLSGLFGVMMESK